MDIYETDLVFKQFWIFFYFFFYFFSFTLYTTYSRIGEGNIMWRHSVPYFPPISWDFYFTLKIASSCSCLNIKISINLIFGQVKSINVLIILNSSVCMSINCIFRQCYNAKTWISYITLNTLIRVSYLRKLERTRQSPSTSILIVPTINDTTIEFRKNLL